MQTYTHVPIGFIVGSLVFPHDLIAQGAVVAGSIVPDIPAAWKMFHDLRKKEKPFEKWGLGERFIFEVGNSIVVYVLFALLSFWVSIPLFAFFFGCAVHIVIDILTHGGVEFHGTEPSYAWPFSIHLSEKFGIYEYRVAPGVLWPPKPLEYAILIISTTIALCLAYPSLVSFVPRW